MERSFSPSVKGSLDEHLSIRKRFNSSPNSPTTLRASSPQLDKKYLSNAVLEVDQDGTIVRKKRLQLKDIEILDQIAEGPLGKVYKAEWKKYKMFVALRELTQLKPSGESGPTSSANPTIRASGTIQRKDKGQSFDKLIRTLRKISLHPNVLRIFGYIVDRKKDVTYLVTEYMPLGDLGTIIRRGSIDNQTINEQHKIRMLIEIATGLCHIHNGRVLHQNLVIHNLLVGADFRVKIADFGYSIVPQDAQNDRRNYKSVAPEYLEKQVYTKKSDVYAFGLLVIDLFSPNFTTENDPYVTLVPKEPLPFIPTPVRPIVLSCLDPDTAIRPSFSRIVDLLEDYYYSNWEQEDTEEVSHVVNQLQDRLKEKDQQIENRDTKIQQLMDRVKSLEDQAEKSSVVNIQPVPAPAPPPKVEPVSPSTVQQNILAVFAGKLKIPFEEFSSAVQSHLNGTAEDVDKIKFLLVDSDGNAERNLWEHLLNWFSPLYPNGTTIQVTPENKDNPFYLLSDVIETCSTNVFFGWLNPQDTNNLLLQRPSGTFLFRFSSYHGWYTLSVSNEGQVGHWRIRSIKGADYSAFLIDERRYKSLSDIITTHVVEPLRINTQKSNQKPVKLEFPCERREKKSETLYSMF